MKQYKIKGYVAKDMDGDVYFGTNKPKWHEHFAIWCDFGDSIKLPFGWFPELKYTDEPVETELMLVQPYMKKNTVTKEQVQENMQDVIVRTQYDFGKPTTYVTVRMKNGFILRESTTCVDPANYDENIGKEICLKKIEDKVWFLLGYALQDKLSKGEER